ncbi:MAG: transcriptional repressor [Candidatus Caldatribacterium sp.]|nr:transcriptional repressor [Candidatus Caldatribacterium sp.]
MRPVTRFGELKEFLKSRGVRPSYIRLRVLEYLLQSRKHPSAEEIYEELQREIPTLSRASVYNALAALLEARVIRVLTIERNEARYDAVLSEHGHFQCDVCGKVYDFTFTFESLKYEGLEGFLVESKDLYFRGICPECKKGGVNHGESRKNASSWRAIPFNGGQDNPRDEEASR